MIELILIYDCSFVLSKFKVHVRVQFMSSNNLARVTFIGPSVYSLKVIIILSSICNNHNGIEFASL